MTTETGVVTSVKDAYGFIRCAERDEQVFFHFSDVVQAPLNHAIDRGDEVWTLRRFAVDPFSCAGLVHDKRRLR
jgi:cold shock CspA family protein